MVRSYQKGLMEQRNPKKTEQAMALGPTRDTSSSGASAVTIEMESRPSSDSSTASSKMYKSHTQVQVRSGLKLTSYL